jgi:Immunity protein 8
VRAVIRHLDRPDDPPDREDFGISVRALVGPADGEGEESFDFFVCTPRWLERERAEKGFLWPRHHLILWEWDFAVVSRAIGDLCAHHEGATWSELAEKLSRYGYWEFEDYRELG